MRHVILGLGPGRCGSATLARLMAAQPHISASHSCPYRPVEMGEPPVTDNEDAIANLCARPGVAFDAAPFWLWRYTDLPKTTILSLVVLYRDPQKIAESMEAIGCLEPDVGHARYAEQYYLDCGAVTASMPDFVRWECVEGLGDAKRQGRLLDWCGHRHGLPLGYVTKPGLHVNAR